MLKRKKTLCQTATTFLGFLHPTPEIPTVLRIQKLSAIRSHVFNYESTLQLFSIHYPGRGLAVNFRKKCIEMRFKKESLPRISYIFLRWMRWIAVIYLFSPRSQYSYKKESSPHAFETLTSGLPSTAYSTAPTVTLFVDNSCQFKSDWLNVGKQMRWIFVRNAVKCVELFYFHRIQRNHRISYNNSPQSPPFLQKFTQKPRPG